MALRVASKARLTISQDNASQPQQLTFDSGDACLTDTATYSESLGFTFNLPAGATDTQIPFASMTEIDMLYLCAKGSGIKVKLVPMGSVLGDVVNMELLPNAPAIIPCKLAAVYASNPGSSALSLIVGAAGN